MFLGIEDGGSDVIHTITREPAHEFGPESSFPPVRHAFDILQDEGFGTRRKNKIHGRHH